MFLQKKGTKLVNHLFYAEKSYLKLMAAELGI